MNKLEQTRKLLIFGAGEYAEVAFTYFKAAAEYQVTAFLIDREHRKANSFCGLPLVDFEDAMELYSPDDHSFFIAVGYAQANALRRARFEQVKAMGYNLASYVSPNAIIHADAQIGEHCFILETAVIEPFVRIGDNVAIWCGSVIGHYSTIGSHCFLALRATIGGGTHVDEQCFIGVGATVRDHIKIGPRSKIGAGAVLLSDVGADNNFRAISDMDLSDCSTIKCDDL